MYVATCVRKCMLGLVLLSYWLVETALKAAAVLIIAACSYRLCLWLKVRQPSPNCKTTCPAVTRASLVRILMSLSLMRAGQTETLSLL